ncbi:MAG: hypothetical protein Q8N47_26580 [Bryobacterales bacterium]|nr:hypothetical protein [Bryobacterales bacterium]
MRTTIDIPDPLYRKLKAKAAEDGCSMKELILRGVEEKHSLARPKRSRVKLPILKSKRPGTLHITNEQIYELIPFP